MLPSMRGFLLRTAICALGLYASAAWIPGIEIDDNGTLLIAAVLHGVVNAVVRPVVVLLTLPITLLTLGVFLWVINGMMLGLVAWLLSGFSVEGLLPAMLGSLVMGLVGWLASLFIGSGARPERIAVRHP